MCHEMVAKLGRLDIKQQAIIDYLKNAGITPVLDEESVDCFNQEYKKFIGEE